MKYLQLSSTNSFNYARMLIKNSINYHFLALAMLQKNKIKWKLFSSLLFRNVHHLEKKSKKKCEGKRRSKFKMHKSKNLPLSIEWQHQKRRKRAAFTSYVHFNAIIPLKIWLFDYSTASSAAGGRKKSCQKKI